MANPETQKEFFEQIELDTNGALQVIISNQAIINAQPIGNVYEFFKNIKLSNGKLKIKIK